MKRQSEETETHTLVLASRLRQLRESLGLVLQDVANLFETNRNVPSQWECALRAPSYGHLLRLADFYGVTVDWLLGREGAERDSPRVRQLKGELIDYLRLKESMLENTTPGERLKLSIDFLAAKDPRMFSLSRLSCQLLVSEDTLKGILLGKAPATGPVVQRFALLVGLPELWFYQPHPQLEDPLYRFRTLVERFQAEGMRPEEVEQRLWGPKRVRRLLKE